MERQAQHDALIGLVRHRLGGDLYEAEQYVRALLESPGWALVTGLVEDLKAAEVRRLTGPKILPHGEYIAVTRGLRAFEAVQQLGGVVLHEADRVRRDAERRVAEELAAGGRGEE